MQVSVVVVCYNEEDSIGSCLRSLLAIDYAKDDFEIVVVDNHSEDATQDIVRTFVDDYSNVQLVLNPQRGIASSRNVGLREARYPYVAFTDADCLVPPDWLSVMACGFHKYKNLHPQLAAVGGTNTAPIGVSTFYDAANIVLKTLLGNRGSTQGREFGRDRHVDHIPTLNILYSKQIVHDLGGFDENFRFVCEDPELNHRLINAGYKIIHLQDSFVTHAFRPGFGAWVKRVFSYGQGRTQLILKHRDHFSLLYLVPPMIVLLWMTSPILLIIDYNLWWLLGGYLVMIFLYTLFQTARYGRWWLFGHVFALYLLTHLSYGIGQVWGLIQSWKMQRIARQGAP